MKHIKYLRSGNEDCTITSGTQHQNLEDRINDESLVDTIRASTSTETVPQTIPVPEGGTLANATIEVDPSVGQVRLPSKESPVIEVAPLIDAEQEYNYVPKLPIVANFDLDALLNSSAHGQALIRNYNARQIFDVTDQSILCFLVAKYFFDNLPNVLLENEDLEFIARLFIKRFPNEVLETYYVHPVLKSVSRDNISKLSSGKFRNKYKND
ncbi:hypothetical protein QAD02_005731 [Eretmocerus hayati]|uniref:Uncharacterized protein n=1 Tax=Eretmocerus hayati TaxID=131215 RepID=A0ACC2NTA4_9HYME|nr:hypothetical protein QAD02_005731 [Eretmocerus hayati]